MTHSTTSCCVTWYLWCCTLSPPDQSRIGSTSSVACDYFLSPCYIGEPSLVEVVCKHQELSTSSQVVWANEIQWWDVCGRFSNFKWLSCEMPQYCTFRSNLFIVQYFILSEYRFNCTHADHMTVTWSYRGECSWCCHTLLHRLTCTFKWNTSVCEVVYASCYSIDHRELLAGQATNTTVSG